jgi:hypothetical protein
MVNAFGPREIIVIGFVETSREELLAMIRIEVKERIIHSLDDMTEPEIVRKFGILVSEDDFSAPGAINYKSPPIAGKETNLKEVAQNLQKIAKAITETSNGRDHAKSGLYPYDWTEGVRRVWWGDTVFCY